MKTKKTTLIFFILAVGVYFYNQQSKVVVPTSEPEITPIATETAQPETNSQLVLTATQNGQTALELLEAEAVIETKDYGEAGMFVTSINGLAGDNEHYWGFYINDEYAQQGVSQTILNNGDIVKFVYEEISQAEL